MPDIISHVMAIICTITNYWAPVAQSVMCLTADACLADPGIASLIPARSHTFEEIDHEIISTAILEKGTKDWLTT